jgi:hypothetical protein
MSKETQRSPDRLDWDIRAADALELARLIPPGPERNEALKLASLLRCTADARGFPATRTTDIPEREQSRGEEAAIPNATAARGESRAISLASTGIA